MTCSECAELRRQRLSLQDEVKELEDEVASLENEVALLRKHLTHDHLTGLHTRACFQEDLKGVLGRFNRGEVSAVSMFFADIDNFKEVNDTNGHAVGDMVLKEVANILQEHVRAYDTIARGRPTKEGGVNTVPPSSENSRAARWGGEELVALFTNLSREKALQRAELIRRAVEKLSFEEYPLLKITLSIGVVTVTSMENVILSGPLLKTADVAMYYAKKSGRNCVMEGFFPLPDKNVSSSI